MSLRLSALLLAMAAGAACTSRPAAVTPDAGPARHRDAGTSPASCGPGCPEGERCVRATCVPLDCPGPAARDCAEDQVCLDGTCAAAACVGIACGPGSACADGTCYPTQCAGSACTPSEVCVDGRCTDRACVGIACAEGSLCGGGVCIPASCGQAACPPGQGCVSGSCQEASCVGVSCPAGAACSRGACADCPGGTCPATAPNGTPCTSPLQCRSGQCADGACCDAACDGPCEACNRPGLAGTCAPLSAGAQDPACGAYVCGASGCLTACTQDEACRPGAGCDGGTCQAKSAPGTPCQEPTDCASGHCTDGVCCDTACDGPCEACNLAGGGAGSCIPVPAGTPEPGCEPFACNGQQAGCPTACTGSLACVPGHYCGAGTCVQGQPDGARCQLAEECQSGQCVDGLCCDSACTGPCEACNLVDLEGTCSPVPARSPGDGTCGSFACDGSGGSCPSACTSDDACPPLWRCASGTCLPLSPNGAACAAEEECGSGICAGGTCCNADCAGDCEGCDVASFQGQCRPRPAGADVLACGGFRCDGLAASCPDTCTAASACSSGYFCDGAQSCAELRPLGASCTAGTECASGACADGVCCTSACTGPCMQCVGGTCAPATANTDDDEDCGGTWCSGLGPSCLPLCSGDGDCKPGRTCNGVTGRCEAGALLLLGEACSTADECGSGACADGVCCDSACTGPCEACNGSGACTPVPARTPGAGCGAYLCDGAAGDCPSSCATSAGCAAPTSCLGGSCVSGGGGTGGGGGLPLGSTCTLGTQCATGLCADGVCCDAPCTGSCDRCNAQGQCRPVADGTPGTPGCGSYLCNGVTGACPTSCTGNADCVPPTGCNGGACGAGSPNGAACLLGTQCNSGFCAQGVCCDRACNGGCEACNGATPGTCTNRAAGFSGSPDCGAYLCTGTAGGCPTSCASDTQCEDSAYCQNGTCTPRLGPGAPCDRGRMCSTAAPYCVDGVCCSAPCASPCRTCNKPGLLGTCTDRDNGDRQRGSTEPARVCCGGAPVDISSDAAHCGGCNTACAAGKACEPLQNLATCALRPVATSGRCRCTTSAECPRSQHCRNEPEGINRCSPQDSSNCAVGARVQLQSACPNYCYYP